MIKNFEIKYVIVKSKNNFNGEIIIVTKSNLLTIKLRLPKHNKKIYNTNNIKK